MLLAILPYVTALGYGVLFIRLVETRSFYLCPFFTVYVLALTVYYPLWNAKAEWQIMVQVFILGLRFCAALEALALAMEQIGIRERRLLAGLVALLMAVGVVFSMDARFGEGPLAQYRLIHQVVNVSVALGCLAGLGYFWVDPPRTRRGPLKYHGAIFTLLATSHAVSGFVKPWKLASALFFLLSLICIGLWLWRGLLVQKVLKPKFHLANSGM